MNHKFDSNKVKIERWYRIYCEECNEDPFADQYKTREEADDAKRAHVEYHRREG